MKKWFEMKTNADDTAELTIFDEIGGWGVTVSDFKKEFDAVRGKPAIRLLLNSPGGDPFDGLALHNILSTVREKLTVEIIGLAASAASLPALAGKRLLMTRGTYLMIHDPIAILAGRKDDLRKTANLLEKLEADFTRIYSAACGKSEDTVSGWMKAETWFSAEEAVQAGFCDEVLPSAQLAACAQFFDRLPLELRARQIDAECDRVLRKSSSAIDYDLEMKAIEIDRQLANI